MFERRRVERRSKIPMVLRKAEVERRAEGGRQPVAVDRWLKAWLKAGGARRSAPLSERRELAQVRREGQRHALVSGEELLEVQVRQLERLGEDDRIAVDAVRAVHEVGRVELQQPAVEVGAAVVVGRTLHDLDTQQDDRRRVADDDVDVEGTAG